MCNTSAQSGFARYICLCLPSTPQLQHPHQGGDIFDRYVLYARDELGDRGHISGLLQIAYRFDERCGLAGADDGGCEAPEFVTYLFPGKGIVR